MGVPCPARAATFPWRAVPYHGAKFLRAAAAALLGLEPCVRRIACRPQVCLPLRQTARGSACAPKVCPANSSRPRPVPCLLSRLRTSPSACTVAPQPAARGSACLLLLPAFSGMLSGRLGHTDTVYHPRLCGFGIGAPAAGSATTTALAVACTSASSLSPHAWPTCTTACWRSWRVTTVT